MWNWGMTSLPRVMFTGLVEAQGKIRRVTAAGARRYFEITAPFAGELKPGDSIAVNGCCLTVTKITADGFATEATGPTLSQTTLGSLRAGTPVNLERALRVGDRLGGHILLGHIDEVARVKSVHRLAGAIQLVIAIRPENRRYLVEKGSIAVDGVSLTIQNCQKTEFTVSIITHTWENTTLKHLHPGAKVNIEYDILVKSAQSVGIPAR